ncbi:MAG: hypothetical protein IJN70_03775 [Clostridia bacterium]|nr:hypothetical protein [Clostridia bacterium]
MKKFICAFISVLMLFGASLSAAAGSIPWDIAENDEAVLYFGQVKKVYYSSDQVVIKPLKVIKGDVPTDGSLIIENIGLLSPLIPGNTYIFAGALGDKGQLDIFFPDSYDTDTLNLAERGSFWEEVQERINSGKYKEADNKRINKKNEALISGDKVKLSEVFGMIKEEPQAVDADSTKLTFGEFYTLCDEIEAYPIDIENNINNSLIRASVKLENGNRIDITSDGKIQICYPENRSIYVVSTEDRDKLLSELCNEKLPFIYTGYVTAAAYAALTLSLVTGIAVILTKKKKTGNVKKQRPYKTV